MLVNPIYGASGSSPTPPSTAPIIVVGGSFGDPLGGTTGSITVTTSGHVGETVLFVVMHRADITVDSSWEFVDKRTTVYGGTSEQHISIYKKTIETSAETYTITSTTERMYCTMYYSDKDIDVAYQQTTKMEKQNINGADCAVVQIDPTDEILVVFNTPYTNAQYGMSMRIENGTIIPQYYTAPSSSDLTAARMVSFFTAQKTKIAYYPWEDQQFTFADVFIYKVSAGSTPSSGYVEEGLRCMYDSNTQEATLVKETATYSSATEKKIDLSQCNSSNGATIEGYILMSGASSGSSYSRGFNVGTSGTEFCIAFGNGGGSSDSDYHFNPMIYWGTSTDYEIYPSGLYYGDKHTFAIVSTPNPDLTSSNILTFYIDSVQVGDTRSQNRESMLNLNGVIIEGGISRPLNGSLLNGRFYTRALTTAELAANHANDIAKYGGNS